MRWWTRAVSALSAGVLIGSMAYAPPALAANCGYGDSRKVATIAGSSDADHLVGTEGDDVIVGLGGNDIIEGLGGNDTICGDDGDDQIFGGDGRDYLVGDSSENLKEKGNDSVDGGSGDDYITAGMYGDDTLLGGPGKDFLSADNGNDTIDAVDGETDHVSCGNGVDKARADPQDNVARNEGEFSKDICEELDQSGEESRLKEPGNRPSFTEHRTTSRRSASSFDARAGG